MPTDRPTSVEILHAIDSFLREHVAPQLDTHSKFHLKVTCNLLGLLQREWLHQQDFRQQELQSLRALMDNHDQDAQTLNRQLCDAIRAGKIDLENSVLKQHLLQLARAKLEIDNPRYLAGR